MGEKNDGFVNAAGKPAINNPEHYPETAEKASSGAVDEANILLFTAPSCPNCRAARAVLEKAGVKYTAYNSMDVKELVVKYGVKQAPTLIVANGGRFDKFRGVSDIKGWLATGRNSGKMRKVQTHSNTDIY